MGNDNKVSELYWNPIFLIAAIISFVLLVADVIFFLASDLSPYERGICVIVIIVLETLTIAFGLSAIGERR